MWSRMNSFLVPILHGYVDLLQRIDQSLPGEFKSDFILNEIILESKFRTLRIPTVYTTHSMEIFNVMSCSAGFYKSHGYLLMHPIHKTCQNCQSIN